MADRHESDGVPAHEQGGTPSPLPDAERRGARDHRVGRGDRADRGAGAGPLGAGRVLARRPTTTWPGFDGARPGGRDGGPVSPRRTGSAEAIPDVTRAIARLRIEGSVLEGRELAAIQRVLAAARQSTPTFAAWPRTAPLTSASVATPRQDGDAGWNSRSIRTAICSTPPVPHWPRRAARYRRRGTPAPAAGNAAARDSRRARLG